MKYLLDLPLFLNDLSDSELQLGIDLGVATLIAMLTGASIGGFHKQWRMALLLSVVALFCAIFLPAEVFGSNDQPEGSVLYPKLVFIATLIGGAMVSLIFHILRLLPVIGLLSILLLFELKGCVLIASALGGVWLFVCQTYGLGWYSKLLSALNRKPDRKNGDTGGK